MSVDIAAVYTAAHVEACNLGLPTYIDPETGFTVITEAMHRKRGTCCGNACRHCPFGHFSVRDPAYATAKIQEPCVFRSISSRRAQRAQRRAGDDPGGVDPDVVFFSGGKDSWLVIDALARAQPSECPSPVLMCTFDGTTGEVPHQGYCHRTVMQQASALDLDLLLVPLPPQCPNDTYIAAVCSALAAHVPRVRRLVFGDLHLDVVRRWREQSFCGFDCAFPLFGVGSDVLLQRLWDAVDSGTLAVSVSAVTDTDVPFAVGQNFDAAAVRKLCDSAPDCDVMGEGGEFHTRVSFPKLNAE
eukprot:g2357.t1